MRSDITPLVEITPQSRAVIIGQSSSAVSCLISGLSKTITADYVSWYDESNRLITGMGIFSAVA